MSAERPDLSGYGKPAKPQPPAEDEQDPIGSAPTKRRPGRPRKTAAPTTVQINTKVTTQIRTELDALVEATAAPAWAGGPARPATLRDVIEEAIHRLYVDRIKGAAPPQQP